MATEASAKRPPRARYFALGLVPIFVAVSALVPRSQSDKGGMLTQALTGIGVVSILASAVGAAAGFSFARRDVSRLRALAAGLLFSAVLAVAFAAFPSVMFHGAGVPLALTGAWALTW